MEEKFSLILTTYNDANVLKNSLQEIIDFFKIIRINYEIIIVDDGSDTENKSILNKLEKEHSNFIFYYFSENLGRGSAVKQGIRLSSGEYAGFIDNDLEIPIHYVLPLLLILNTQNLDMIIANRIYKMELKNLIRYFFTSGYHMLVNFMLKLPGYDTESGLKIFRRKTILPILEFTPNNRWFWDTEIVFQSYLKKLKIGEYPIALHKKYDIPSSVSFFKDIIEYSINLIKLWKKRKEYEKN